MGDPRPTNPEPSQDDQERLLRRTGNSPTEPNEEELLQKQFGAPDESGIYGAPTEGGAQ